MTKDQTNNNLIQGTCDSILDTTKTIYNEEYERFKQTEAKVNIALAFSGVLLGVYLSYLDKFKPLSNEISYLIYTFSFKITVFFCLTIGILYFLKSIKTEEYSQVSLHEILTYEFARESESVAKMDIAATYKEAIDLNRKKIESKLNYYKLGLKLMTWGFVIFIIHFLIEEVIKHAI